MKRIFTIANGSKKAAIVCFAVLFCLMMKSEVGSAQTILAWDFNTKTGGETTVNSTTTNPNLAVSSISRGSGLLIPASGPNRFVNTFDAIDYSTGTTSLATAISAQEYMQFAITPNVGYQVSLSTLDVVFLRSSANAPNSFQWQYSLDGFATAGINIGSSISYTGFVTNGAAQTQINLSGIAALQNVYGNIITIRIYGWGAGNTGSTFALGASTGTTAGNDLAIGGTVIAALPTITTFSPINACAGSAQNVTITGTNLSGATAVKFGTTSATIVSNTATQIVATMPASLTAGNYVISVTTPGGTVNSASTFTVLPNNTVTAGTTTTLCINTAISPGITHTTTGATGVGAPTGLPAGVTASFASNTITISGTPTAAGTFSYSIPLTGGCGNVNATGTIIVKANNTAGAPSSSPTLCINTAISPNITITTTGATGIGAPTGLPAGVTAAFASNTITISGTPTAAGTFSYSIPLTGGCGNVNATGTITVTANNTAGAPSSSPTLCINTAISPNITITTTGATGIGTTTGLPAGVTAAFASNTITISGTPTTAGTFSYSIPLTGGCGNVNAMGTITVTANNTVGAPSSSPTLCINTAISPNITIATTGATGIGTTTGLPAGVTAAFASNTITISGTPTAAGIFNYSIPLTGGCGNVNATGSITVNNNATIALSSAAGTDNQTICGGNSLVPITYTIGGLGTTGATLTGTLPSGITGSYSGGTFTISGTSIAVGNYSYTVTTTGPCVNNSLSGTVTITTSGTVILTSPSGTDNQTVCINNPVINITYAIGGDATGASITAGALPTGVNGTYDAGTGIFTITGTPTISGTFNYTVTASGSSCANLSASGTIKVNPATVGGTVTADATVCSGSNNGTLTLSGQTGNVIRWESSIDGGNTWTSITNTTASQTYTNLTQTTQYRAVVQSGVCPAANSVAAIITVNPIPNAVATPSSQPICSGTAITTIVLSGSVTGTTFSWTRDNTATVTGIAASGSGDISGTLTNSTTAPVTVTFTIIPTANTCVGTAITATVTVNPKPVLSSSLTPPARCSNVSTTYTAASATVGTTFTWTRAAVTGITPATGSGGSATITETLINSTANPITVTYVIVLTANGCSNTQSIPVTVNPSPVLSSSLTPPAICSNTAFSYTATSATSGVTYGWSRAAVAGISNVAASGSGATVTETLVNTTANPVNVTYVYTLSANGCINTQNVVVTVNPTPTLSNTTPPAICNNTVFSYNPASATTGTTFDWSRAVVAGISNPAATGTNNPNETLINTTANPVNVVYIYTLTANGCTNTQNVTVSVKPTPTLSSSLTPPARCSNVSTTYTAASATVGTTFTWTRAAVTGITPATGSGGSATITETLINSTANPITVTYVIVLTANGCSNTQSIPVTVNPSPVLSSSLTPPAICSNTAFSYTATSATSGVTYSWSRAAVAGISNVAASGSGATVTEILVNTTANPVNVTYVYTLSANGCINTQNVVVTVNPTPTLSSGLTQNRCDNVSTTYTSSSATSGVTYTWSRAAVAGISNAAASGSGAAITETLDNTTTDPVNVVYSITLTANGCSNVQNVTITVNPKPVLSSSLTPPARCSNVSTTYIATSATSGVTYTWSRAAVAGITPATGAGGTANIVETLVNSTANPINITYAITLTANGCSNTQNVVVTVNPTPTLNSGLTQNRCDNVSTTYTASSATSGVTYSWSRAAVAGISNAAASGSGATITETLDNTTANPINITYVITLAANGCSNVQNVTVTVNPTPVLSSSLTPPARCSNTPGTYTATSTTTAATFSWSRAAVTGISNAAASGSGATITETLVNTTTSPINIIYVVTLTINGCTNTQNVTLTINPLPTITPAGTAASRCFSASVQTTTLSYSNATANPTTYSINYNAAANTAGFVDVTDAPLPATPIIINIAANTPAGTYTGSITVKNANGCTSGSATSFTVTINPLPVPTLTNSPASPVCANTNVTYTTDASQANYVWTFSGVAGTDYAIVSGGISTSSTTVVTWKTAGSKTVTVNYTNSNGCTSVTPTSNVITVDALPAGTFTAVETSGNTNNDGVICAGDPVTFTFSNATYGSYIFKVNGAVKQTGTSNTYSTTTLANNDQVTVDVANASNCGATFGPITITVNPLTTPTLVANKTAICPGDNVTFTATPTGTGFIYNFKVNGSSVQSGAANTYSTTSLTAGNSVTVDLTNANGCTATSTPVSVTINAVPSGTLTATENSGTPNDNKICAGSNVTFTATSGFSNYNF